MFTLLAVTASTSKAISMNHIALFLAALCFITVLPALFDPRKTREALDEFFSSNNTVIRLASCFHLLIAFIILNTHWTFEWHSGRAIMTVIGYLVALRGILWLWFPNFIKNMSKKILHKEYSMYLLAVLGLLLGFGLVYMGGWML